MTPDEWEGTTAMEGIYSTLYLDYTGGRLYLLNDWHVNGEGIHAGCFNHFEIRAGTDWFDIDVYDDSHIEVLRNYEPVADVAVGAYGFGPSPGWPEPHTLFEFSFEISPIRLDICEYDPVNETECEKLSPEPVSFTVDPTGPSVRVARRTPADVFRVELGRPCGRGQGLCVDGARCESNGPGVGVCRASAPDAGPGDAGAGDAGPSDAGARDAGPPF